MYISYFVNHDFYCLVIPNGRNWSSLYAGVVVKDAYIFHFEFEQMFVHLLNYQTIFILGPLIINIIQDSCIIIDISKFLSGMNKTRLYVDVQY